MFLYAFWTIFALLLLCGAFLAWKISLADMRRRIIPDAYLFPLLIDGLIIVTFFPWVCSISDGVMGMLFGYILAATVGFFFDRAIVKRNPTADAPIGMGDIKLIATGGLWMGAQGLAIALVFACVFGAIWARIQKQKYIPFAPFFISGTFLSLIIIGFLI